MCHIFFWILVSHRLSATQADNVVIYDKAVIVNVLVAGLEIVFARMLISVIHERGVLDLYYLPLYMYYFVIVHGRLNANLAL